MSEETLGCYRARQERIVKKYTRHVWLGLNMEDIAD
jgi:hypothetical protein